MQSTRIAQSDGDYFSTLPSQPPKMNRLQRLPNTYCKQKSSKALFAFDQFLMVLLKPLSRAQCCNTIKIEWTYKPLGGI